jgi:hypothetical protein
MIRGHAGTMSASPNIPEEEPSKVWRSGMKQVNLRVVAIICMVVLVAAAWVALVAKSEVALVIFLTSLFIASMAIRVDVEKNTRVPS